METEEQLEDALSAPSASDIEAMRRLTGDIIVLGAGGKMGPSLTARIKRAAEAAGANRRVIAVSRFSLPHSSDELESAGVEAISCDLLDRQQIAALPDCENVFFLAGRKFGSTERTDLTWAINSYVPGLVAERYRASRIVAFSTGNIYPFVKVASGGSVERDAPMPQGEYAQSCLGRERIFEYFAHEYGTRCVIFRLNYAVDLRYGVLVDIARKVFTGQSVNLFVAAFNIIWQGDANSYALRCLELCDAPSRILNVTGPETISTRHAADFFAQRFQREAIYQGEESATALLNNASLCHSLLGYPSVAALTLMEMVARWVEVGGASLNKPTKFEVMDGKY
ncbi:MAG: NAD-dependent epimerase/dehydratase family protein [Acidobacteriota bacterium]|nr:NAD-dependent epimerase/dehydratase family protein [Acidobacteriota bacterium]